MPARDLESCPASYRAGNGRRHAHWSSTLRHADLGAELDACLSPTLTSEALPLPRLSEELFAIGKAIGLEKEAEQHRAVGRNRLVLIAGRAPHELTGPAFAFMVLSRSFDHIALFQWGVLVQRHDGARLELEQGRGDSAAVRIEDLDPDTRKLCRFPGHVGHIQIMRRAFRRILRFDVGMHKLASLHGHDGLPGNWFCVFGKRGPLDVVAPSFAHFGRRTLATYW